MASTSNPDASEVRRRGRHRLIGAIVIAVLLAVFVPMLLDSEPRTPHDLPALEIPSQEKVAPLPPALPAAKPAPVVPAKATADVVPAKAGTQSPTPKLEGFAVQVGAFKEEDKLKLARDKLAGASLAHYTERHPTSTGELVRLRAGPYATREAAEKALASVKAAGLEGQVVPLP